MSDDNPFFNRIAVDKEVIDKTNLISKLRSKRDFYISKYKNHYLEHLKNEYNTLKILFPEVKIIPEARIKSQESYNNKVTKVVSSDSSNDIYDIFANRYVIYPSSALSDNLYTIPTLYRIKDFLASSYTNTRNIPERLKDYVASPKNSTYQSLHLTRIHIFEENYYSETQLRTYTMHSNASKGLASHTNYKKRVPGVTPVPNLLEYVLDERGFCLEVREMSFEKAFEKFFGIPFDSKFELFKEKYY